MLYNSSETLISIRRKYTDLNIIILTYISVNN